MSNDKDILNRLKELPDQATAPDHWHSIEQEIVKNQEKPKSHKVAWLAVAMAACALLAVLIPSVKKPNLQQNLQTAKTDDSQQLNGNASSLTAQFKMTIHSLEQANAYYYARLGKQVKQKQIQLPANTWSSLASLRDAQKQYYQTLSAQPNNVEAKHRLFWLYQKERDILRQFAV